MSAGIWKLVAVVLSVLLLVVATGGGTGWRLAATARDQALASLAVERDRTAKLRVSIGIQNEAVESMHRTTVAADVRRRDAQALADANGRRLNVALAKLTGARATTCDEAMPYVDQLLRDVK